MRPEESSDIADWLKSIVRDGQRVANFNNSARKYHDALSCTNSIVPALAILHYLFTVSKFAGNR